MVRRELRVGGTLGGSGIIAGPLTVGDGSTSGSTLAPSAGSNRPMTLTLQGSLTFNGQSNYTYRLNANKGRADGIAASSVIILSGAQFILNRQGNRRLPLGTSFVVINNSGAAAISGNFSNLADGDVISAGRNHLQVSYEGGDGNDLTLTVVR